MLGFGRSQMVTISAEQLRQRLTNGDSITVVDVRDPWEFQEGHIKGSLLCPLSGIRSWAKEFHRDEELILVCRTGSRSGYAYNTLSAMGFTNLKNLAGGLITWHGEVVRGGE